MKAMHKLFFASGVAIAVALAAGAFIWKRDAPRISYGNDALNHLAIQSTCTTERQQEEETTVWFLGCGGIY